MIMFWENATIFLCCWNYICIQWKSNSELLICLLSLILYWAIKQSTISRLNWLILKKYYFFHVFNFLFKWLINIINIYKNWLSILHILVIMKLLFFKIILIIIKLFDIKHSVILQNIYLSSSENFVLIITCFLKIFIS